MKAFLKKLWNDYGIGAVIVLLMVAYGIFMFAGYLGRKGMIGSESNSHMQSQYKDTNAAYSAAVQPSEPLGHNEVFASANGVKTSMPGIPAPCSQTNIQNPAELLPRDTNSQWAAMNPTGKGELANVNLLKAGYHIGIDTVGQSLRNANLQIRSEPPNPQMNTGPWNQSTITPDLMRPPLEIGSGPQLPFFLLSIFLTQQMDIMDTEFSLASSPLYLGVGGTGSSSGSGSGINYSMYMWVLGSLFVIILCGYVYNRYFANKNTNNNEQADAVNVCYPQPQLPPQQYQPQQQYQQQQPQQHHQVQSQVQAQLQPQMQVPSEPEPHMQDDALHSISQYN